MGIADAATDFSPVPSQASAAETVDINDAAELRLCHPDDLRDKLFRGRQGPALNRL
jgi:hypothetical protein